MSVSNLLFLQCYRILCSSYLKYNKPPIFFRQKNLHALVSINRKIFGFGQIFELFCPVEVKKIAAILARDRVQGWRVWRLLWRHFENPTICISRYFAPFNCYVWEVRSILVANMPHRCVVGGCSNVRSLENGIALHTIPFYGENWKLKIEDLTKSNNFFEEILTKTWRFFKRKKKK